MSNIRKRVQILGLANDLGYPGTGVAAGPDYLLENGCIDRLVQIVHDSEWKGILRAPKIGYNEHQQFNYFNRALVLDTYESFRYSSKVWAIGGDHSSAFAFWTSVYNGMNSYRDAESLLPLGMIWFDAHMDAHTHATTRSGNLHGMPLAFLLGEGLGNNKISIPGFRKGPALQADKVCLMGVRSYEREEKDLLDRLGVKYFTDADILADPEKCFEEAKAIVTNDTGGIGITIDLDVLDPSIIDSVNTPAEGGLPPSMVKSMVADFHKEQKVFAVEIAEFNPDIGAPEDAANFIYELLIESDIVDIQGRF